VSPSLMLVIFFVVSRWTAVVAWHALVPLVVVLVLPVRLLTIRLDPGLLEKLPVDLVIVFLLPGAHPTNELRILLIIVFAV